MNWIAEWCKKQCKYGDGTLCADCTRVCDAKQAIADGAGCSLMLIDYLIVGHITHPKIADAIADFTGATPRQRDRIVHKRHRGTYKPDARRRICMTEENAEESEFEKNESKCMVPIVALDRLGNEVTRFESVWAASEKFACTPATIRDRCKGKIGTKRDEFQRYGMTFRYAMEWDAMSDSEKVENIARFQRR